MNPHDLTLIAIFVVAFGLGRAFLPARGAGVDDARLARLERKVDQILNHLGVAPDAAPTGALRGITAAPQGVEELILAGKKINAIKLYREQTGVGLKDAKDAVEGIEAQLKTGQRS